MLHDFKFFFLGGGEPRLDRVVRDGLSEVDLRNAMGSDREKGTERQHLLVMSSWASTTAPK